MKNLIENRCISPYQVGGLLYTPATARGVSKKILSCAYPGLSSLVFCLEDAILDEAVTDAEKQLLVSLRELAEAESASLPLLFVRVRNPQHLAHVHGLLGGLESLLAGYVFPKFDLYNADEYLDVLASINAGNCRRIYCMPTLESASVCKIETRSETLAKLKGIIDFRKELILNIRVGGNDLCSLFGLRRSVDQTIYDAGVVRDALVDIVNVFSRDYVVSGPVWEYYAKSQDDKRWEIGLKRELALDSLNGFIGKTAIHPSQLPIINESMKVAATDYDDACAILNWKTAEKGVSAGSEGRMNEIKCHSNWARKTLSLAEIYGIRGGQQ